MNRITLSGKVVVITGAAGGLGSAYARECARRGAALLLTDVDESRLRLVVDDIGRRGGIARAAAGDIADAAFTDALAGDCVDRWGRVDGWVNNAGIQVLQRIDEPDTGAAAAMVRVNVLGTINGVRSAASAMQETGGGSIVNVTSGAQFGMEHLAVYGATKGAIASLTYASAIDLADLGVRVNAISPLAHTRMTEDGEAHFADAAGARADGSATLSSPDAVAGLVSFLLSDASADLTGQTIRLDGRTLSLVRRPAVDEETAVDGDAWPAEAIAEAIAGPLSVSLHRGSFVSPARRGTHGDAARGEG